MAVKKIREGVYFPKVSYGRKVKNVIFNKILFFHVVM